MSEPQSTYYDLMNVGEVFRKDRLCRTAELYQGLSAYSYNPNRTVGGFLRRMGESLGTYSLQKG